MVQGFQVLAGNPDVYKRLTPATLKKYNGGL